MSRLFTKAFVLKIFEFSTVTNQAHVRFERAKLFSNFGSYKNNNRGEFNSTQLLLS